MRKSIHTTRYRQFCELLTETREKAGLTQIKLARRLRWTQSAVSKVERGERRLDILELLQWTGAMDVSFSQFAITFEERVRNA